MVFTPALVVELFILVALFIFCWNIWLNRWLFNDSAPSTITPGMIWKAQNCVLQTYLAYAPNILIFFCLFSFSKVFFPNHLNLLLFSCSKVFLWFFHWVLAYAPNILIFLCVFLLQGVSFVLSLSPSICPNHLNLLLFVFLLQGVSFVLSLSPSICPNHLNLLLFVFLLRDVAFVLSLSPRICPSYLNLLSFVFLLRSFSFVLSYSLLILLMVYGHLIFLSRFLWK